VVQAVVFDIGGVLELTPPTGWRERWRLQRGIPEEQFDGRLRDRVRTGMEEGLMEPDPAFYAVVCRRLGVLPEQAVFVDDLAVCVEGAEAVGMTGVLHRDNATTIAAVEAALDSRRTAGPGGDHV